MHHCSCKPSTAVLAPHREASSPTLAVRTNLTHALRKCLHSQQSEILHTFIRCITKHARKIYRSWNSATPQSRLAHHLGSASRSFQSTCRMHRTKFDTRTSRLSSSPRPRSRCLSEVAGPSWTAFRWKTFTGNGGNPNMSLDWFKGKSSPEIMGCSVFPQTNPMTIISMGKTWKNMENKATVS